MRTKKPASSPFHNKIIKSLEDRLRANNREIWTEHKYKHHGDHEADILVLNFKRKYAYAIEVKKTNHREGRKKAREQLAADELYLKERWRMNRVYKFFAHGTRRKSDGLYEIHLIKPQIFNNRKVYKGYFP